MKKYLRPYTSPLVSNTRLTSCFRYWGLRYTLRFMIQVDLKVPTALYLSAGLKYTTELLFLVQISGTRRASSFGWIEKYLRPSRSQVHVAPQVLGGEKGTCNRSGPRYSSRLRFWVGPPGPRYTSRPRFWVGKKVPATSQIPDTPCASSFGWGKRYLRPSRSQIHVARLVWVDQKVSATFQVSGTRCASCFRQIRVQI